MGKKIKGKSSAKMNRERSDGVGMHAWIREKKKEERTGWENLHRQMK